MRGVCLTVAAALASCIAYTAAYGGDATDVPWDEIDRIIKESPPPESPLHSVRAGSAEQRQRPADAPHKSTPAAGIPAVVTPPPSVGPIPTPKSPGPSGQAQQSTPAPRPAATPPVPIEGTQQAPSGQIETSTGDNRAATLDHTPQPGNNVAPASNAEPSAVQTGLPQAGTATPSREPDPATGDASARRKSDAKTVSPGDLYLPLVRYISARATDALARYDAESRAALLKLYETRMGRPLWVTRDGYDDAGRQIIAALKDADGWGLRNNDYALPDLSASAHHPLDDDALTAAEVRVSLAAMQYAVDARGGRIPSPESLLSSYLDRTPQPVDREALVKGLIDAADKATYLQSFQPKHPQFQKLREKLIELRKSGPALPPPPIPDGPLLKPGESHPQIAMVRARLKATVTDGGGDPGPERYDKALADAVVAFKEKKGIAPVNPNITNALRRALSNPREVGEATLIANMEEWRWMPDKLGEVYINVNIPEFLVRLVKDDKVLFEERIVSGKPQTQTPIFSNVMRTVVLQPR